MRSEKLLTHSELKVIQRGQVLKCKNIDGHYTFLMVCEVVGKREYQLLIISGYKAGLHYCTFPNGSISHKGFGLNREWLIENWSKWGYQECDIGDVLLLDEPFLK